MTMIQTKVDNYKLLKPGKKNGPVPQAFREHQVSYKSAKDNEVRAAESRVLAWMVGALV